MNSAAELANQYNWGPAGFRQAASFQLDNETQYFVELEAGGVETFRAMLVDSMYSPYSWRVRHFLENETNETEIRFTPEGKPYGFTEMLSEDEPGAAINADSAKIIAELAATDEWQIDLSAYELVEQSQELRPGGRIDHTLVYERSEPKIGETHYRLRLKVGGDRLTELKHFVDIPEAFSRRFTEMRSANDSIATISVIAMAILYGLGGFVIGLFFLLRQRWVIWKQPLFWGLFIAFLQVANGINQWPLAWMNYDTAVSAQGFLIQQVVQLLLLFIGAGLFYTLAFMTAESLTRKAFPNHIRFWKLWSPEVAASTPVAARTVSGYLLVTIFFAFDIALYFFATEVLGWWSPSGALFEPDTLATYFPWLNSIAISLQAGFMEECLFRAVPIAGAALIGRKLGGERYWIIGAFIIQALIFGSGHANYPNQPSYARVVELIIPSIGFGLIYLFYGLLPSIILHFVFDVVWFAIPIFSASSPGIWVDQMMIIILTLVPVLVIIWSRIRAGKWNVLQPIHYNKSWQPEIKPDKPTVEPQPEKPKPISGKTLQIIIAAGLICLALWFVFVEFNNYAPTLSMSRTEAEQAAEKVLSDRNIEVSEKFEKLSCIDTPLDQSDKFIWQEGGEEMYQSLIGEYMAPPEWHIRFVQFEGDVAERAEEYQLFFAGEGEIQRFHHKLPEARAGVTLAEDEARQMAYNVLIEKYKWNPYVLKAISASPSKLPERTDWVFIFADTINYKLEQGEARILIEIAGNEVVDDFRFIHIPEDWERQERNNSNNIRILSILGSIITILIYFAGIVGALVSLSRGKFSGRTFLIFFGLMFVLLSVKGILGWPCIKSNFTTAQPYSHQMLISIAVSIIGLIFISGGVAVVNGFVDKWRKIQAQLTGALSLPGGFFLGFLISALLTFLSMIFEPSLEPTWASYENAASLMPFISTSIAPLTGFIVRTVLLMLIFTALDKFSAGWSKRKLMYGLLFILVIIFLGGSTSDSLGFLLLYGVVYGIILLLAYIFVFRHHIALLAPTVAGMIILTELKKAIFAAYPAAMPGAIVAIILTILLAIFWFRRLNRIEPI